MENDDNNLNNEKKDDELNEKESNVKKWLIIAYERAINGIPNISEPIDELVENYTKKATSKEAALKEFIKNQILKRTTSGFVTGFGGIFTLPLTLPANVTSVLYIQLRMVAAIAKIYGYDIRSDAVQTYCYICLLGNAAANILKDSGIKVCEKFTINAVNLSKCVPLVGGIVGGAVDNISTRIIANRAIEFFKPKED